VLIAAAEARAGEAEALRARAEAERTAAAAERAALEPALRARAEEVGGVEGSGGLAPQQLGH
jgi:hypothetical protein